MASRKLTPEQMANLGRQLQNSPSGGIIARSGKPGKGEGHRIPGIGAVATGLNVLDQLHSAITGGLRASFQSENQLNPGAVASEFWKGLKGDTHTSYSQILEDAGIHSNWVKAPVGFAMDVALDPLTYVGVGRVGAGGLAKGTAELLAGKELTEQAVKASAETGAAKAAAAAATAKSPGAPFGYAVKAAETAPPPEISSQAIATRAQQMMAEHPRNWEFRYGLPTATPRTITFKEPDRVTNILQSITGAEGQPRQALKMFSRKAEQPHGLAEMQRVIQGGGQADFADQYGVLRRIFNKMSPDDRHYAFMRLEKPEKYADKILDYVSPGKFDRTPALSKLGYNSVDDIVDEVKGIHRKILDAELSQGQHLNLLPVEHPTVVKDGASYVDPVGHRVDWNAITNPQTKTDILDKAMAEMKLRRIVRNSNALDKMPGLARSLSPKDRFQNLNKLDIEMIPHEAKPVIDIGESTLERLRDTYKMQGNADFVRQAIKKFGIDTKEVEGAKEIMQNLENADLDKKLKFRPIQPGTGTSLLYNDVAKLQEFANTYLPSDVADVLNATHKTLTDESVGRTLLTQYDRVLGHWKAFNSLANPGYLARTSFGDFIQNAVAGVWDPRRYSQSARVLREAGQNRVDDVLAALRNPDAPLNALHDGRIAQHSVSIGGAEMPSDRIYNLFHSTGAPSGELITEQLPGSIVRGLGDTGDVGSRMVGALKGAIGKHGEMIGSNINRYEAKMADVNVGRETWQRMANFINKMDHEATSSLQNEARGLRMSTKDLGAIRERVGPQRVAEIEQTAAEAASKHTRQYNIDYGMLSSFEKDVMRRVVPFYSWFRLNAPQQLAQLASHPGVMTGLPKTMNAIEELIGTQDPSGDFMLPDWIRESMPMRLAMGGEEAHNPAQWLARKLTGVGGNNAVFVPTLQGISPMQDLEKVFGPVTKAADIMQMRGGPTNWHNWSPAIWAGATEAAKTAANEATPAVKGLYEAGMKKSAFTGADITNFNDWALSQAGGPGRELSRLSGISDSPSLRGLSSTLLGLPVQPITQQTQKGEYQRRSDILTPMIKNMKDELAAKRHIRPGSYRYEHLTSPQIKLYKKYLQKGKKAVGY